MGRGSKHGRLHGSKHPYTRIETVLVSPNRVLSSTVSMQSSSFKRWDPGASVRSIRAPSLDANSTNAYPVLFFFEVGFRSLKKG